MKQNWIAAISFSILFDWNQLSFHNEIKAQKGILDEIVKLKEAGEYPCFAPVSVEFSVYTIVRSEIELDLIMADRLGKIELLKICYAE